jgi:tricorn protease interacting factor F2/3
VLQYDLALDIDFDGSRFRGALTITDYPVASRLELDAVDLEISEVRIGDAPASFEIDRPSEKLRISVPDGPAGPLLIRYSGPVAEGMQNGLFVSRLAQQRALSTHMEPEGCRRLLPCFDRPDHKAVFRLQVTAPADLVVLGNMPGRPQRDPDGRATWTFDPTPPMSTYLLYVGVGRFEESRDHSEEPEIIIAGPVGSRARTTHGLKVARAAVRALAEYYGVPFPLPKLHLIALSDFWVGMENWGAILGSEEHYLLDGGTSPTALRFGDQTIVHEIAHQWFGDLVTLAGWEDLWLNEAFATFVTPRIDERARIREDPWGEFVMFSARGDPADSLTVAHPVRPDLLDPKEMMAAADNITYFKGARLVRMVEAYLGEEPFRRGISTYLRRHQFRNARSADLWAALEESSGRPVARVMQSWVERAGFPCIAVEQRGPDLHLAQRRFTYLPGDGAEPPWPIPLTIADGAAQRSMLFDGPEMTLPNTDARRVRLDPGRAGFFRILLAPDLRASAIGSLMSLPALDRWGFLHDARAFLLSGDYTLPDILAILQVIEPATDLVTVEEVCQLLHFLGAALRPDPSFRDAVRRFGRAQLARLGETGRPGEPASNDTLRELVTWRLVTYDDDLAKALAARFDTIDTEPVPIRRAIALAFARFGPAGAADRLMARAGGPDNGAATDACWAIQGLTDPHDVQRFLDFGLTSVRLSDLFIPLVWGAALNPTGRAVLWTWLQAHLRELEGRGEGTYLLPYVLDGMLPALGMERDAEVRAYFERERFLGAAMGIRSGLEILEAIVRLRRRLGIDRAA